MDTTITNAEENIDSVENDETHADEREEQEVELEDEPETAEPQDETTEQDAEEDDDEREARRQRRESQVERLKKERDELKKKLEAQSKPVEGADDALLARLELRGVTEPDDQREVIRYAKAEGKSPIEILNDDFMKSRLEHLKKQRTQRQASPAPGNRTGAPMRSVAYYIRKGEVPTHDRELAAKVRAEMARIARETA